MERLSVAANKLGITLTARQMEQFRVFYQELLDWNRRLNLTTITDYVEVQTKHFLDSLTVTLAWPQALSGTDCRVIDVGTGAGLPGIPMKIALPGIKLVLLEATAKKADFLHHLKDRLGLDDVEIVAGRAETAAHQSRYREQFQVVLSRAVAYLPTLVELALPFCATGGRFIAQKKGAIDPEVNQSRQAISLMGGNLREVKGVRLEEFTDQRWLVIVDKMLPTPPQYPRRAGIPLKRPLL